MPEQHLIYARTAPSKSLPFQHSSITRRCIVAILKVSLTNPRHSPLYFSSYSIIYILHANFLPFRFLLAYHYSPTDYFCINIPNSHPSQSLFLHTLQTVSLLHTGKLPGSTSILTEVTIIIPRPSRKVLRQYVKVGHDRFSPHPYRITGLNFSTIPQQTLHNGSWHWPWSPGLCHYVVSHVGRENILGPCSLYNSPQRSNFIVDIAS
jgi:hypothetical protein